MQVILIQLAVWQRMEKLGQSQVMETQTDRVRNRKLS